MSYRRRRSSPFLRNVAWGTVAVLVFSASFLIGNVIRSKHSSDALQFPDGVRVDEGSTLTYYLKVNYDGVDSSTTFVSDKVPDGLIFQKFVANGSGVTACSDKVLDDTGDMTGWINNDTEYVYHGLHYTVADRTVRFKVKNLQADCQLQVGIETKTPMLGFGQDRMDFYNIARHTNNGISSFSDMTHYYIGSSDSAVYQVSYRYTGDIIPDNAPVLPEDMQYSKNATVDVLQDIELDGYNFSGWISTDVEVKDNQFKMPARTVVFYGGFTEKLSY